MPMLTQVIPLGSGSGRNQLSGVEQGNTIMLRENHQEFVTFFLSGIIGSLELIRFNARFSFILLQMERFVTQICVTKYLLISVNIFHFLSNSE